MKKKNVILLIVSILLIIGGSIMVAVKGFNVKIYLREHDTLKFVFEQAFEKSDVKNVCEEVFGDKKFEVRTLEVFDDAVYIMATEITEEEEEALLTKLSALYVDEEEATEESSEETTDDLTEETTEESTIFDALTEGTDYEFYHDSKIRLRDISKPYVIPTVIAAVIIVICMMVRYGIMKSKHVVLKTLEVCIKSGILLLDILAIIALARISVSAWLLPCVMFIVMIYLIGTFEYEIRRKDEEAN